MKNSLLGRHLVISIIITSLFVLGLALLSSFTLRQIRREAAGINPSILTLAKLVGQIRKEDRTAILRKAIDPESQLDFWLVSGKGEILYSSADEAIPTSWDHLPKPQSLFESRVYRVHEEAPALTVVQVDESPLEYLLVRHKARGHSNRVLYLNLGSLILAVIMGTSLSFFFLFYTLRQKANLAERVITDLQSGNLKARFPITKMDEAGQAMLKFNKMADEIERLVEQIKSSERSRMDMLQELAHDLRTPVASMKSLLETLTHPKAKLNPEVEKELLELSQKEVDYFENLVEDLLFLAQTTEPQYNRELKSVDLKELVDAEINNSSRTMGHLKIERNFELEAASVNGNLVLLRRLLRNGLENAMGFAKSTVTVNLKKSNPREIECVIEDDGPGFSAETLKDFGRRKLSRSFNASTGRRATIGLGSVIMNSVVALHRGRLVVQNKMDSKGAVVGAIVRIFLPTA